MLLFSQSVFTKSFVVSQRALMPPRRPVRRWFLLPRPPRFCPLPNVLGQHFKPFKEDIFLKTLQYREAFCFTRVEFCQWLKPWWEVAGIYWFEGERRKTKPQHWKQWGFAEKLCCWYFDAVVDNVSGQLLLWTALLWAMAMWFPVGISAERRLRKGCWTAVPQNIPGPCWLI